MFGTTGRNWLAARPLPNDERRCANALLRQLDFHGDELKIVDRELAVEALEDPVVKGLMTIPGVDSIVAMSVIAAVGDFSPGSRRPTSLCRTSG